MKEPLPVRYFVAPTALVWAMSIIAFAMVFTAIAKSNPGNELSIWFVVGWTGLFSLVGAAFGAFIVVPWSVSVLRQEYRPMPLRELNLTVTTHTPGGAEGVILRGLPFDDWKEAANKIIDDECNEYEFSVAVLGRPLHDKIRPKIKNNEKLCYINPDKTLTLTEQGKALFRAIHDLPPSSDVSIPVFVRRWLK